MRVLILHQELPFPPDNGGKLRAAHLARYFARHHEVSYISYSDAIAESIPESKMFSRFQLIPTPAPRKGWRRRLSRLPSEVGDLSSELMSRQVNAEISAFAPEAVVTASPMMTQYLESHSNCARVLDYLMVLTLSAEREQALAQGADRWLWSLRRRKLAAFHRRIAPHYDLCLVNSREDQEDLLEGGTVWRQVEFVPNGLELDEYPLGLAEPDPNTLVYPGSVKYLPNRHAVDHFIAHILPRIRATLPEVRLVVTGAIPDDGSAPTAPGVEYTGYVTDVRPVIAGAWACVVPLLSGAGGTRFKVLEALALATPVVSTTIGAEGVDFIAGQNMLLADSPAKFAEQTLRVLQSRPLRAKLAAAGRSLIESQYAWEQLGARISHTISDLKLRADQGSSPTPIHPS